MRKKVFNSEFIKNSLLLMVGTGVAQLLPLGVQFYIRRVFSDAEFGLFAQYFSVVSIISIIAGLKYESSIVIPKSEKSSLNLLVGTVFFNVCTSLFVSLLLFFVGHQLLDMLNLSQELSDYFWLMPISIFLISTNISLNFWLTKKKKYKKIVGNKIARRTSEAGTRVLLGAKMVSGGIIFGAVIGDFINFCFSFFQFKRSGGRLKDVKRDEVKKELKKQSDFPKYHLLPSVLNVVSSNLPIFLFSSFYSDAIVGQFNGSRELLSAPLALISISLSQVLYQKLVDDVNNQRKIVRFLRNNFLFLLSLAILGVLIIGVFGVEIFTFVFGDNWVLSGELGQILVFSYAIRFIVSPLSMTFIALKKLKISALWQIGSFALTMSLFLFDGLSTHDFVMSIVLIDLISYSVYAFLIFYVAKEQDKNVDKIILEANRNVD